VGGETGRRLVPRAEVEWRIITAVPQILNEPNQWLVTNAGSRVVRGFSREAAFRSYSDTEP